MKRIRFVFLLFLSSLSLLFSSHLYAQTLVQPLSDARDNIVFPDLSDTEKLLLAEQAQLLLQGVYVHRFEKQAFYPGVTDPVPAVQAVLDNIDEFTVDELEAELYRIFSSQRDLHLNYIFPQPYANFTTFLPFTLKRVQGRDEFFVVRVDSVNAQDFADFAPDQIVPEVGDRVIAYNGQPIIEAAESLLEVGQGANRFGGFSRALARLTFRPQLLALLPEEDEVTVTFRTTRGVGTPGRPREYTITIPWINSGPAPAPEPAPEPAPAALTTEGGQLLLQSDGTSTVKSKPRKLTQEDLGISEDLFQKMFNDFRKENSLLARSEFPNNPSSEPAVTWGVIENRLGKFGYIRLSTFVPVTGNDAAFQEIRRIIFDEFDGTVGMMFDIRDNGGGSVIFSDELTQLFGKNDVVLSEDRLLNTDTMSRIFNESVFGTVFPIALDQVNQVSGTDATHTSVFDLFETPDANRFGQVYNGPVAVLVNANSFSASDFFACHVQDSGIGFVFGEEPRTGAGGANVFEHSLLAAVAPTIFTALPGTHRARVSFGQGVRTGLNDGEFIEDFGCSADLLISPRLSDLINGNRNQITEITSALKYLSFFPRFRSEVRAPTNDFVLLRDGTDLGFPLRVRNTPRIRMTVNGEVVGETFPPSFFGTSTVDLSFPDNLEVGATNSVLLEGIGFSGKRLWNLRREVIVLEDPVVVATDGLEINFADAEQVAPFTVVNSNTPETGWNLVSPALQLGFNPTYADNVNSDAILSVDLTALASAQLSFDMEYDTEVDFDFIEVFVTDSDGNTATLLDESGAQALQTFDFDISEFAGKTGVQVHFRFISDASVVAQGVRLERVSIR